MPYIDQFLQANPEFANKDENALAEALYNAHFKDEGTLDEFKAEFLGSKESTAKDLGASFVEGAYQLGGSAMVAPKIAGDYLRSATEDSALGKVGDWIADTPLGKVGSAVEAGKGLLFQKGLGLFKEGKAYADANHTDEFKRVEQARPKGEANLGDIFTTDGTQFRKAVGENWQDVKNAAQFYADHGLHLSADIAQSTPAMAAGMGLAGMAGKGLVATGLALGTEGISEGGNAAYQVGEKIAKMSHEDLSLNSDAYNHYFMQTGSQDQAKALVARDAMAQAGVHTAGITMAMGKLFGTGKFEADIATGNKAGGMIDLIKEGVKREAPQEAFQSMGGEAAQNEAIRYNADDTQKIGTGLAASGTQGFIAGGAMGAGIGAGRGLINNFTGNVPEKTPKPESLWPTLGSQNDNRPDVTGKDGTELIGNQGNSPVIDTHLKRTQDELKAFEQQEAEALNAGLAQAVQNAQAASVQNQQAAVQPPAPLMPQDPELQAMAAQGVPVVEITPTESKSLNNEQVLPFAKSIFEHAILNETPVVSEVKPNQFHDGYSDSVFNVPLNDDGKRLLMQELSDKGINVDNDTGEFTYQKDASNNITMRITKYGVEMRHTSFNNPKSSNGQANNQPEPEPEPVTPFDEVAEDAQAPEQNAFKGLPIQELPVDKLTLSNDVPQFKDGANESGVVEPLGGKFDRTGVAPIQVWQRNDGRMEVISGRHRLDLARRSGERTIPAQVHREADGFDAAKASTLDAELNIRDGQGKVADYVQYFTKSNIDKQEAIDRGLLSRAIGKRSYAIATQGDSELIAAHRAGIATDLGAYTIATAFPNDGKRQQVALARLQQGDNVEKAVNVARALSAITGGDSNMDMFGFDDAAIKEAERMAKEAVSIQRQITNDIAAVQGAAKNPKAAAKFGVNVSDPDGVKKRIEELKEERAQWDNWHTNPALVAQLRGDDAQAVEPIAQTQPNTAQDDFLTSYDESTIQSQEANAKALAQQQAAQQNKEAIDAGVDNFSLDMGNVPDDDGGATFDMFSDPTPVAQPKPTQAPAAVETVTPTYDTISDNQEIVPSKSGEPFKSEKLARLSATFKNTPNAEIKQIGDKQFVVVKDKAQTPVNYDADEMMALFNYALTPQGKAEADAMQAERDAAELAAQNRANSVSQLVERASNAIKYNRYLSDYDVTSGAKRDLVRKNIVNDIATKLSDEQLRSLENDIARKEAQIKQWQDKVYKANTKTVTVGMDEGDNQSTSVSIGYVNEKRRNNAIRSLRGDIDGLLYMAAKGTYRPAQEVEAQPEPKQAASESMETPVANTEAQAKSLPQERIDDVGESIAGAKKMTFKFTDALAADVDIASVPLSKSFPKPDYVAMAKAGAAHEVLALVAMTRDLIPAKPKVAYRLKSWVGQVEAARKITSLLMENSADGTLAYQRVLDSFAGANAILKPLLDVALLASKVKPEQIETLSQYRFRTVQGKVNKSVIPDYDAAILADDTEDNGLVKGTFFQVENINNNRERAYFLNYANAQQYILDAVEAKSESTSGEKRVDFGVFSVRGQKGYQIGKKVSSGKFITLETGIASIADAKAMIANDYDRLKAKYDAIKDIPSERKAINNPRIGEDYRNGRDVTATEFAETFGFRGVQFGNYVDQGKRQEDLNNAYDGFMDLAGIIGVPPKALSLNSELGMAFGARGSGGKNPAKAHYEPDMVVINMTKASGSGSLAHEWFHALDNYFSRLDNEKGKMDFASEKANPMARPEVMEAWKNLRLTIKNETQLFERSIALDSGRSKDYWSTVLEMVARSFERYVIDKLAEKGFESDYLANIIDAKDWDALQEVYASMGIDKKPYPYPLDAEAEKTNAAYDALFDAIETKVVGDKVVLFSKSAMKSVDVNIKRGTEAMNKAIAEKTSVNRAMYRNDIGWVDFVWGDEGVVKPNGKTKGAMGLSHIIEARMRKDGMTYDDVSKFLTQDIVKTIANGKMLFDPKSVGNSENIRLDYDGNIAYLAKNKGSNSWIITAFVDNGSGSKEAAYDSSIDTFNATTPSRSTKVAEPYKNTTTDTLTKQAATEIVNKNSNGKRLLKNGKVQVLGGIDEAPAHVLEQAKRSEVASDTIMVDGVERPTRNSNGQLIHPTKQGIENFWRWFGDSKVVDADGKPLVVYHGTKRDFNEFKLNAAPKTDDGWFGDGFYTTAVKSLADNYAMRDPSWELTDEPANTMPLYVKAEYPYTIDAATSGGMSYEEGSNFTKSFGGKNGFKQYLDSNGYDSVILQRDKDMVGDGADFYEIVSFDANEIKSAIGNNGDFDAENKNILYSQDGSIQGFFDPVTDTTYLVADALTADTINGVLVHEVGVHAWWRNADKATREALGNRAAKLIEHGIEFGNERLKAFYNGVQSRLVEAKVVGNNEEAFAYLAEEAINEAKAWRYALSDSRFIDAIAKVSTRLANLMSDAIAYLKSSMHRLGWLDTNKLTGADLVAIAKRNMREVATSKGVENTQSNVSFSKSQRDSLAKFVNDAVTHAKEYTHTIGQTPEFLRSLGVPVMPIKVTSSTIRKAVGLKESVSGRNHSVDLDALINLPSEIENPIAVFSSASKTKKSDGGITLVAEIKDKSGSPVVIAIHMNREHGAMQVNLVRSIHGKEDAKIQFDKWKEDGKLLFADEERLQQVHGITLIQFQESMNTPFGGNAVEYDSTTSSNSVNFSKAGTTKAAPTNEGKSYEAKIGDDVRIDYQDDMLAFKRVQETLEKKTGKKVPDVYESVFAFKNKAAAGVDAINAKVNKALEAMSKLGVTPDVMGLYLYAKGAKDRNAMIEARNGVKNGSGMSDARADQLLADLQQTYPDIDSLTAAWYDIIDGSVLRAEQTGLLTDGWLNENRKAQPFYVPMKHDIKEGSELTAIEEQTGIRPMTDFSQGIGKAFNLTGKEIKKANGRISEAGDILTHIVADAQRLTIRAEKNVVGSTLAKLATQHKDDKLWVVQKEVPSNEGKGVKDGYVGVKVKGNQYYIVMRDERLAKAAAGVNSQDFMWLDHLNQFIKKSITAWNPVFTIVNSARDTETAYINARGVLGGKGANKMIAYGKGAMKSIWEFERNSEFENPNSEWSQWMQLYLDAGGKTGFRDFRSIIEVKENLDNQFDKTLGVMARIQRGVTAKEKAGDLLKIGMNGIKNTAKWLEDLGAVTENVWRVAAFRVAIEQGKSAQEAAKIARELTVNFNRKGHNARGVERLFLFYNAAIQGTHNLASRAAKDPLYFFGKVGGSLLLLGATAAMLGGGDDSDEWANIPEEMKMRGIPFHVAGQRFVIPMAYGFGLIPYAGMKMVEMAKYEQSKGKYGVSVEQGMRQLVNATMLHFNPFGGQQMTDAISGEGSSALQWITPTVGDPLVQIYENTNVFGKRLRPESFNQDDTRPDSEKVFDHQRGTWYDNMAKGLNTATGGNSVEAGVVSVAPSSIKAWADLLAGGWGREIGRVITLAGKSFDDTETIKAADIPVLSVVWKQPTDADIYHRYSESTKALNEVKSTMTNYIKAGDTADAVERKKFMSAHKEQLSLLLTPTAKDDLSKYLYMNGFTGEQLNTAYFLMVKEHDDKKDELKKATAIALTATGDAKMKAVVERDRLRSELVSQRKFIVESIRNAQYLDGSK